MAQAAEVKRLVKDDFTPPDVSGEKAAAEVRELQTEKHIERRKTEVCDWARRHGAGHFDLSPGKFGHALVVIGNLMSLFEINYAQNWLKYKAQEINERGLRRAAEFIDADRAKQLDNLLNGQ